MRTRLWTLCIVGLLCLAGCRPEKVAEAIPGPEESTYTVGAEKGTSTKTRRFQFRYRFKVSGVESGKQVRAWLPVPPSNEHQTITASDHQLPTAPTFHADEKYGNRILFVEAMVPESGSLSFDVPYEVVRHEILASNESKTNDAQPGELFLAANSKVPLEGKPLELLSDLSLSDDPFQKANQLYEVVDKHVTYNKDGKGWGNGDVLWVCDSGRGNCTDFHSLFISLARSQGIASRFEIGFPIPTDAKEGSVGGYHCWAFFFDASRGWVPVDISEADKHPELKEYYFGGLTADRVMFSVGRDIELVPKSTEKSLNYFVYPHLEVDGQKVSRDQIELQFSYTDL